MSLRFAQFGTKHGHAAGKYRSLRENPEVECVGIYEPDLSQRAAVANAPEFADAHWYQSAHELLGDASIVAAVIEGRNDESLAMAHEAVAAGKHLWYDKPAGDDLASFQALVASARRQQLQVQMGYMFRYHLGFRQIADWARAGLLGELFSVRAHMSTNLTTAARKIVSVHRGGIFYDLGAHMLDQIVWLLGRPDRVQGYFRNDDTPEAPAFSDNTLGVFEFAHALAFIDIAAMEPKPMARRFEVYGTKGSAVIVDPFEPASRLRLCLEQASDGYAAGEQFIDVPYQTRQAMYDRELEAFVSTLQGHKPPDRSLDHELLVQETLLRTTRS